MELTLACRGCMVLRAPRWGGGGGRAGTQAQGETLYRLGSGSKTFFANIPDLIVYYCTHDFFTDSFGAKHKLLAPEGSAEAHTGYLDVR